MFKLPDHEKLISFLEKSRVAKFTGLGIEVEFFQELPDLQFPEPQQQQSDEDLTKQYLNEGT
jgi:hypothetical protein|tara:strand:- start:100 stop:285 length:186 start_codon:yes stop_codon:yes gene_type:complete